MLWFFSVVSFGGAAGLSCLGASGIGDPVPPRSSESYLIGALVGGALFFASIFGLIVLFAPSPNHRVRGKIVLSIVACLVLVPAVVQVATGQAGHAGELAFYTLVWLSPPMVAGSLLLGDRSPT
ncbi:MAG: hypothetical protein M3R54_02730 [Chloroflexota bacterium]|nr:hypothetical protein [Chloroflexota bacterium]